MQLLLLAYLLVLVPARYCNPRIPGVFANPESSDWQWPNCGIFGLQKFVKIAFFRVLNDKNINSGHLNYTIAHGVLLYCLLFTVGCILTAIIIPCTTDIP